MLIALDYDGTYTKDKAFWDKFLINAQDHGHDVVCVTMRFEDDEAISDINCKIIYTSRQAKMPYMLQLGINVDIWIDDNPKWIMQGAS